MAPAPRNHLRSKLRGPLPAGFATDQRRRWAVPFPSCASSLVCPSKKRRVVPRYKTTIPHSREPPKTRQTIAGAAGEPQAGAQVMRERKLIHRRRPLERRKGPRSLPVERPRQLWQLDMTSIWVAKHGWCYLNAIINCYTREIVLAARAALPRRRSDRRRRTRGRRARHPAGRADARLGQRLGLHRPPLPRPARRARDPPPPPRLPRPRIAGLHREPVSGN